MIKIGIIERRENYDSEKPFNKRYALDSYFKDIAEKLDIILIPIVSSKHIDEVVDILKKGTEEASAQTLDMKVKGNPQSPIPNPQSPIPISYKS